MNKQECISHIREYIRLAAHGQVSAETAAKMAETAINAFAHGCAVHIYHGMMNGSLFTFDTVKLD